MGTDHAHADRVDWIHERTWKERERERERGSERERERKKERERERDKESKRESHTYYISHTSRAHEKKKVPSEYIEHHTQHKSTTQVK